ncbi:MAG TPA: sigma-70 family RNA polymerase sigma factor [Gemmataceae bacterium]|nr:sigma-70 family RNA polymerase sigma factor [Gemmataceae bacterium]
MTAAPLDTVLRHIRKLTAAVEEPSDGQLLHGFTARRDESAFAALVRRHGPLVLGVCRRLLANPSDAEDAFQATFLVLVRRAATLDGHRSLGPWLYGVARRTALKARAALRRHARQTEVFDMPAPEPAGALEDRELHQLLEEELDRLPEKYRAPLVLCYLQGRTHEQAARELGRPSGSMSRHVGRALELLRGRLGRRGVVLPAAVVAAVLTNELAAGAMPSALAAGTVRVALLVAAGGSAVAPVAALAGAVARELAATKVKTVTALLLALVVLVGGAGLAALPVPATPAEPAEPPARTEAPARADSDGDALPAGALMRFGSPRLRHGQAIGALAFSKDGKALVSGSLDLTVSLWELPSGKERRRFAGHANYITCVAVSPDGKFVAGGAEDFRLWDAATGKELYRSLLPAEVWGADFSPDGKRVAYAAAYPKGIVILHVIDVPTGKPVVQMSPDTRTSGGSPHNSMGQIAFAPGGKTLASAGYENVVRLWDVAGGKQTAEFSGHTALVLAVAFAPDGKTLASGSYDGTARLWDVASGKEVKMLDVDAGLNHGVTGVAFSPDGKQLAACTTGSRLVRVYDTASGKETHTLAGGRFRRVVFSPDGKTLAAGDGNNAIRLWEMPSGKLLHPAEPHHSGVHCIALSPDGKTLAAATTFKTVYLWDVTTGKPLRRLEGHEHGVYPVAFSPDGKRVASGSRDGTARVWDVATGKELHQFLGYDGPKVADVWVYGVSFAPDGKRLAGACRDGFVRVWDLGTGREVVRCEGHTGFVWGVAFAADGKTLVSCGDDAVRLWDAEGKEVRRLAVGGRYEAVAFSPDGRLVAAGTKDGGVQLIDVASGRTLHTLKEHANLDYRKRLIYRDGRTVAFSPDGRMVAWGSWQVAQVWEVATGQERLSFDAHRGEVMSVAFLPDGRRLATGSPDTTAVVWDLPGCVLGGPAAKVTAANLEGLWSDLFGDDGHKSYRALWTMAAAPTEAMPLLRTRLKPAAPSERDRQERLIKDLDADEVDVREKATDELAKLGGAAEPALRKVREGKPSAELKQRVELLLGKLQTASASPERTGESRALELLEQLRTPEATALLKELAKGDPDAWLTKEATAALKRAAR